MSDSRKEPRSNADLHRRFATTFAIVGIRDPRPPHQFFADGWRDWLSGQPRGEFPGRVDLIVLLEQSLRALSSDLPSKALAGAYRKGLRTEDSFLDTLAEIHVAARFAGTASGVQLHVPTANSRKNFDVYGVVAGVATNIEVKRTEDSFPEHSPIELTETIKEELRRRRVGGVQLVTLRTIPGSKGYPTIASGVADAALRARRRIGKLSLKLDEYDQSIPDLVIFRKDSALFEVFPKVRFVNSFLMYRGPRTAHHILLTLGPASRRPVVDMRLLGMSIQPEPGVRDYSVPLSEGIRDRIRKAAGQLPRDGAPVVVIASFKHLEPWHVRNACYGDPGLRKAAGMPSMTENAAFAQSWGKPLAGVVWLRITPHRDKRSGAIRTGRLYKNPVLAPTIPRTALRALFS